METVSEAIEDLIVIVFKDTIVKVKLHDSSLPTNEHKDWK